LSQGDNSKYSNAYSRKDVNKVIFEEVSPFIVDEELFENDACF